MKYILFTILLIYTEYEKINKCLSMGLIMTLLPKGQFKKNGQFKRINVHVYR